MLRYLETINGHNYMLDTNTNTVIDEETEAVVTKVWVYPVKQYVTGADRNEILYFPTSQKRAGYIATRILCEKLPRCKVYSNLVEED